jgi:hypothetical protein
VEGVEDRDRVGELVVDGVLVAMKWIERGNLDPLPERLAASGEPVGVGLPGPARDQVEQPRLHASVLVAGQIDHAGQRPRATPALVDVMPQMLIDAKTPHAIEPGRIISHRLQPWLDAGHTVRHVVPSRRARPSIEACSAASG